MHNAMLTQPRPVRIGMCAHEGVIALCRRHLRVFCPANGGASSSVGRFADKTAGKSWFFGPKHKTAQKLPARHRRGPRGGHTALRIDPPIQL